MLQVRALRGSPSRCRVINVLPHVSLRQETRTATAPKGARQCGHSVSQRTGAVFLFEVTLHARAGNQMGDMVMASTPPGTSGVMMPVNARSAPLVRAPSVAVTAADAV